MDLSMIIVIDIVTHDQDGAEWITRQKEDL